MDGFLSLLQVFSQASVPPPLAAQPLAVEFRADQSVRDGAESAASQSEPGPADPGQPLLSSEYQFLLLFISVPV